MLTAFSSYAYTAPVTVFHKALGENPFQCWVNPGTARRLNSTNFYHAAVQHIPRHSRLINFANIALVTNEVTGAHPGADCTTFTPFSWNPPISTIVIDHCRSWDDDKYRIVVMHTLNGFDIVPNQAGAAMCFDDSGKDGMGLFGQPGDDDEGFFMGSVFNGDEANREYSYTAQYKGFFWIKSIEDGIADGQDSYKFQNNGKQPRAKIYTRLRPFGFNAIMYVVEGYHDYTGGERVGKKNSLRNTDTFWTSGMTNF